MEIEICRTDCGSFSFPDVPNLLLLRLQLDPAAVWFTVYFPLYGCCARSPIASINEEQPSTSSLEILYPGRGDLHYSFMTLGPCRYQPVLKCNETVNFHGRHGPLAFIVGLLSTIPSWRRRAHRPMSIILRKASLEYLAVMTVTPDDTNALWIYAVLTNISISMMSLSWAH
ncbi:hypothetical protein IW262DRAFT_811698 [Armillaria fumosa]|nr:hypothetical protein IW262DRAFT_811698 [Armillaria fumosa]